MTTLRIPMHRHHRSWLGVVEDGTGPDPRLPAPVHSLIPTVKIAPAVGWPDGDVLVAETAAPEGPEDGKGIKGFFMGKAMKRAGSAVPSANRITLLRDTDGDGVADQRSVLLAELNSPFGMALVGDQLYVANTDALLKFPYRTGDTTITARGTKVADLPGGKLNHHWTKNVIAGRDGSKLPERFQHGMFVGQHGSWNRKPPSGYRVIFVPFSAGKPSGLPIELLTGFVDDAGNAKGRPVGIAVDNQGGVLVADDVGNVIWRVSGA